jgi:hypothetical protein
MVMGVVGGGVENQANWYTKKQEYCSIVAF